MSPDENADLELIDWFAGMMAAVIIVTLFLIAASVSF